MKRKSVLSVLLPSICSLVASLPVYSAPTQFGTNFYDFVSAEGISWQDANNAAASSAFGNVNGYLATITSAAENNFLMGQFAAFSGFAGAWLGGEVNTSGTGIWMTGPETGQIFSQGGSAVSGAYANWGGIEPNGPFPSFAYMNIGTSFPVPYPPGIFYTGQWADAANGVASSGDPIKGYFVEYTTPVPLPPAILLFVTGIGGVAGFGLRKKTRLSAKLLSNSQPA